MRWVLLFVIIVILFCGVVLQGTAFDFNWEIDETPEGSESATVVEPVQVVVLDEAVAVPSYSASLALDAEVFCASRSRMECKACVPSAPDV